MPKTDQEIYNELLQQRTIYYKYEFYYEQPNIRTAVKQKAYDLVSTTKNTDNANAVIRYIIDFPIINLWIDTNLMKIFECIVDRSYLTKDTFYYVLSKYPLGDLDVDKRYLGWIDKYISRNIKDIDMSSLQDVLKIKVKDTQCNMILYMLNILLDKKLLTDDDKVKTIDTIVTNLKWNSYKYVNILNKLLEEKPLKLRNPVIKKMCKLNFDITKIENFNMDKIEKSMYIHNPYFIKCALENDNEVCILDILRESEDRIHNILLDIGIDVNTSKFVELMKKIISYAKKIEKIPDNIVFSCIWVIKEHEQIAEKIFDKKLLLTKNEIGEYMKKSCDLRLFKYVKIKDLNPNNIDDLYWYLINTISNTESIEMFEYLFPNRYDEETMKIAVYVGNNIIAFECSKYVTITENVVKCALGICNSKFIEYALDKKFILREEHLNYLSKPYNYLSKPYSDVDHILNLFKSQNIYLNDKTSDMLIDKGLIPTNMKFTYYDVNSDDKVYMEYNEKYKIESKKKKINRDNFTVNFINSKKDNKKNNTVSATSKNLLKIKSLSENLSYDEIYELSGHNECVKIMKYMIKPEYLNPVTQTKCVESKYQIEEIESDTSDSSEDEPKKKTKVIKEKNKY
uniref:Uncharacterized protein n=1 Tax=viral metagenome TaxID=1070528 RepID=A0A6C0EAZ6_9ZZZZ